MIQRLGFSLTLIFIIWFFAIDASARSGRGSTTSSTSMGGHPSEYSFFAGTGVGYSFPGPLRARIQSVELGTYGPALGVAKSFGFDGPYGQIGLGMGILGKIDFGIIGAIGYERNLFWILGLRGELFSYVGSLGLTAAGATIGLSIYL